MGASPIYAVCTHNAKVGILRETEVSNKFDSVLQATSGYQEHISTGRLSSALKPGRLRHRI